MQKIGTFESINQDQLLKAIMEVMSKTSTGFLVEDVPFVAGRMAKRSIAPFKALAGGVGHVRKNGWRTSMVDAKSWAKDAAVTAKEVPGRMKRAGSFAIDRLRSDLVERPETRVVYLSSLTSLLVGAYLGNEAPDLDWKLHGTGVADVIGGHRNVFFHSAMTTAAVLLMGKLVMRLAQNAGEKLEEGSQERAFLKFLEGQLSIMTTGAAVGVAAHLVVDGTFQGTKSIENPFAGTFVYGTIADDNAWLLYNGVISILSGKDASKSG